MSYTVYVLVLYTKLRFASILTRISELLVCLGTILGSTWWNNTKMSTLLGTVSFPSGLVGTETSAQDTLINSALHH